LIEPAAESGERPALAARLGAEQIGKRAAQA
jgi:hypothetical protein